MLIKKLSSSLSKGPPKKPTRQPTIKCLKLFAFHRIYIIHIKFQMTAIIIFCYQKRDLRGGKKKKSVPLLYAYCASF